MRERTSLEKAIATQETLESEFSDTIELLELAQAEGDDAIAAEAEADLRRLQNRVAKQQLEALLSGEADGNDSFLEVHAGAGGTESQDWAEMLLRMYVRWSEAHGHKVEWLAESAGRHDRSGH